MDSSRIVHCELIVRCRQLAELTLEFIHKTSLIISQKKKKNLVPVWPESDRKKWGSEKTSKVIDGRDSLISRWYYVCVKDWYLLPHTCQRMMRLPLLKDNIMQYKYPA